MKNRAVTGKISSLDLMDSGEICVRVKATKTNKYLGQIVLPPTMVKHLTINGKVELVLRRKCK